MMEAADAESRKRQEFEARRKIALDEKAKQVERDEKALVRRKLRDQALKWSLLGSWLILGGISGIGIAIAGQWGWGVLLGLFVGWFATAAGFGLYFVAINFLDRLIFRSNSSSATVLSLFWIAGPTAVGLLIVSFMRLS